MTLPEPFGSAAHALVWALHGLFRLLLHISSNVASLGLAWVLAYWMAVFGLWSLGSWGQARLRKVRSGNDIFEFNPTSKGGDWLGRINSVIRLQVQGEAWAAGVATVVGYAGSVLLLTIGVFWAWLTVVVAWWVAARAMRARRLRRF